VEVVWQEGQAWIRAPFYEGPHELLLVFAQRARLSWRDLSLSKLFNGLVTLFPHLSLEEQAELLVFVSHLIRLKALALLPAPPQPTQAEPSPEQPSWASFPLAAILEAWEPLLSEQAFRWPRPASPQAVEGEKVITGLSAFRLVRAYQEVLQRLRRRQTRTRLTAPPFTLEEVEASLVSFFQESPTWPLDQLWQRLYPHPFYRAVAFLLLLDWIQEGRLLLQAEDPWSARLSWVRS